MTFDQFINTWLGEQTDYDKVYKYQCVDLILQYLADVHGIRSGVSGNAIDYWTKPSPRLLQDFEKVQGGARRGDIVVLNGTRGNPYGHIGIAVDGKTMLEQNGAQGDADGQGGDEVRYTTIPYSRVAGILRKKGGDDMIRTPEEVTLGYQLMFLPNPSQADLERWIGKPWEQMLRELDQDPRRRKVVDNVRDYDHLYNTAVGLEEQLRVEKLDGSPEVAKKLEEIRKIINS